jgi:hypothetical protein
MSRPPQSAAVDASQAELEEEEAISGTGEGDEVMEEAEEQEGYSKSYSIYSQRISSFPPLHPRFRVFRTRRLDCTVFNTMFSPCQLHQHPLRH